MADKIIKIIDADTKLRAYALFTMAQERCRESREFEEQLGRLLGYPVDEDSYLGCISDEIAEPSGKFNVGLKKEGFSVKPNKRGVR